jgi:hypothetical protein
MRRARVFCARNVTPGGYMNKIRAMAKEDIVEDLRAVYGDTTADQIKLSGAVTLVETTVVDHRGDEHVLDLICKQT